MVRDTTLQWLKHGIHICRNGNSLSQLHSRGCRSVTILSFPRQRVESSYIFHFWTNSDEGKRPTTAFSISGWILLYSSTHTGTPRPVHGYSSIDAQGIVALLNVWTEYRRGRAPSLIYAFSLLRNQGQDTTWTSPLCKSRPWNRTI